MTSNIFEQYIDTIQEAIIETTPYTPQWCWEFQPPTGPEEGAIWIARAEQNAGKSAMVYETASGYRTSLCMACPVTIAGAPSDQLTMEVALANEGATFCSAIEAMLWVEEQAWRTLTRLFASDEQPVPASRLLVQRYGTNTRELTWQRAQVTVGRDRDNDLVIPHPLASRHHARFEQRSDGVYLCDLSSTNGTYVNGVPLVGERRLCDQDEIIIADTIIIFEAVTPVA